MVRRMTLGLWVLLWKGLGGEECKVWKRKGGLIVGVPCIRKLGEVGQGLVRNGRATGFHVSEKTW